MLAVAVVLVLCRNCSAQVGGCTPPAGSNLIGGNGKLSNNIPQPNRGGLGREFYNMALFVSCLMCCFRTARSHWRQWSILVGNVQRITG